MREYLSGIDWWSGWGRPLKASLQQLLDRLPKQKRIDWLVQVDLGSSLHCLVVRSRRGIGGPKKNWSPWVETTELLTKADAASIRQEHVNQVQIKALVLGEVESFCERTGCHDLKIREQDPQ
jgi:hypothetical protein